SRRQIRQCALDESPSPIRTRAKGAGAMTLKPLHLDIEYRDAFGRGAAQAARVPPRLDDDVIRALAPALLAAHRHSSHGREPLWARTVPLLPELRLLPLPKAVQG